MKNLKRLPAIRLPIWVVGLLTFLLMNGTVYAQTTIKGIVRDKDGKPVPSATITVKGKKATAVTGDDGTFSIPASSGEVLIISSAGFKTLEQRISSGEMTIVLQQGANALEEVVVVGYGTQKRATVTGAVSSVKAEDLARTPATTTSAALVGKIQGVTARATDSRPGNGTNIQIRNLGAPLYVIDGVPYGANNSITGFGFSDGTGGQDIFNTLGLEDIESITVLKDASAAIYGLRASNGVVLVTTKKGKRNEKTSVNLSGYYGFQNFTRYFKPANAGQYIRASVESDQNNGLPPGYSKEELAKWEAGTEKGYKSYDYFKEVMRPDVPQSYISASASGGSAKSSYYLAVSNLHQEAIIKDYSYNRMNLQANMETALAKGLKVGTQISGRLEKKHNVGVPGLDDFFNPFLSVLSMWPTESPYANDNPLYINQTHNVNVNPATYKNDVTGWVDEYWRGIDVKLNAQYDFNFGLTAKTTIAYNYANEDFNGFEYTWDAYTYNASNDTYTTQPGFGNQNPWRERHKRNVWSRYIQGQLNYAKQIGPHSVSATLGYERSDNENTYFVVHTIPPNNYIPLQFFANQDFLDDQWRIDARAGYIGRLNYNYEQKYLVELLGRYDGTFLYRSDKRWGFFPGFSVGWRISQESFFKDNVGKWLNDLKLRVAYGETGIEMGVNAFDYLQGYNFGGTGVNDGRNAVLDGNYVIGIRPRGLPITNLSWVVSRSKNIGIDFTLLGNKLTGQFDVFERRRIGLPASRYDVLLPSETGYTLPNENLNVDATRGLEGIITWSSKVGQFDYSIGANATVARLRLISTYKPRRGNSWDYYRNSIEDRWDRVNFGYHVVGRFESQQDIDNYGINNDGQGNRTELPGDFKFEDVNGDKIINAMDQRPIGFAEGQQPYMSFGINGSIGWKGFSLQFDFAGATMQSFLRDFELRYPFQNNGNSPDYMFTDRWHRADPYDPNSAWIPGTYPAIRRNNTTHINYQRNDFWVTNVHYIRLKNLVIGYELPAKLISKAGLSRLRFYVNGTNLFSFDNVRKFGIDPEIQSTNGLVYPQQKLLNFGFNATF